MSGQVSIQSLEDIGIFPRRIRAVTLLLGAFAALLSTGVAEAQSVIDSVMPADVRSGDGVVNLVATLSGQSLPPDRVGPSAFEVGTLAGENIAREGTRISADVQFPDDFAAGVYDVTIVFPSPQGELALTLTGGVTVNDGGLVPVDDGGSVSNGLIFKSAESEEGYTLFSPMGQTTTYLIDHGGNVAHTWDSDHNPNLSVYLLDDGSILRTASDAGAGLIERIDRDGNLVWSWTPSDPDLRLHHDIEPLSNGNLLAITYDVKTAAEAVAAGRDPALLNEDELWSECILEIEPSGTGDGTVVWQWCVWDHLVQDHDPSRPGYGVVASHPERIDLNYTLQSGADWLHANGIDYNADLDQILISLHSPSEIWIIDHSTSSAEAAGNSGGTGRRGGDLLYRWGNLQVYAAGNANDQQLFGQHDAQWIDSGIPGGTNILIFNNGQRRTGGNYSSVDEIVPPLSGYNYGVNAGAVWGPAAPIWAYTDPTPSDFYADQISGAQRLPNGNTLICDGPAGEFFEVTSSGEIVWDYLNPYAGNTLRGETYEVFRATRFALDAAPIIALGLEQPASGSHSYPIVDTGQISFYDDSTAISAPAENEPFHGQDAHYDGYQPSYEFAADGLSVHDRVTGLTWTRSPDLDGDGDIDVDDKLTYEEALIHADTTLNPRGFGGYDDWRLPSMKELYSLMNFTGTDPSGPSASGMTPFIDTAYFDFAYGDTAAGERTIDAQFWSDDAYVGTVFANQPAVFGLNLADGRIKGYPASGPVSKLNYVYFVRGNPDYGLNDFVDNGDGTVTDHTTGLMWSRDDSGAGLASEPRSGMTWEEALAWVRQRNAENHLGYSDWRLPNAKELQSIIDYGRSPEATASAAIDPVFDITAIVNEGGELDYPWFWTGTTHVRTNGNASAAVYICFGRAMGYVNGTWMDVHGAGAQRSDRKGADFSGYSYASDGYYFAQSPQGDAVRIYNYVRLVRIDPELSVYSADVQEAYVAYYGRPADPDGRDYWAEQLSRASGNLDAVIEQFGTSQEFVEEYGVLSDEELIDTVYDQLFCRAPDAAGRAFYLEQLRSGAMTLPSITLDILKGAQNEDAAVVDDKLTVAAYFTSRIDRSSLNYGAENIEDARSVLRAVCNAPAGLEAGMDRADQVLEMM